MQYKVMWCNVIQCKDMFCTVTSPFPQRIRRWWWIPDRWDIPPARQTRWEISSCLTSCLISTRLVDISYVVCTSRSLYWSGWFLPVCYFFSVQFVLWHFIAIVKRKYSWLSLLLLLLLFNLLQIWLFYYVNRETGKHQNIHRFNSKGLFFRTSRCSTVRTRETRAPRTGQVTTAVWSNSSWCCCYTRTSVSNANRRTARRSPVGSRTAARWSRFWRTWRSVTWAALAPWVTMSQCHSLYCCCVE
jgi:hypothetical protein